MSENIKRLIARQPQLSESYILALGTCVFYFSSAEWMAIACCEIMDNGYSQKYIDNVRSGARNVAEKLISLTKKLPPSAGQENLLSSVNEFEKLVVDERNVLLHAYPAAIDPETAILTNPHHRKHFEIEDLEAFAQRAFDCQGGINHSYYKFLKPMYD